MEADDQTVPTWVLTEVGRLHLHTLALERALAEAQQPTTSDEVEGKGEAYPPG